MKVTGKKNVLHFPENIGGNPYGLSRQERSLGYNSDCVVFEKNFTDMKCDYVLFKKNDSIIVKEFKKWMFFFYALFKYDVFHFNFGQKFFPAYARPWKKSDTTVQAVFRFFYFMYSFVFGKLDLIFLKAMNKKVFVLFQGDDIRQGDISRSKFSIHFSHYVDSNYYDDFTDQKKRKIVKMYDKYCDEIFAINPDLLHFLPERAKFLRYCHLDLSLWAPVKTENKIPVVVHAPTHRLVKGTKFVLDAVDVLKKQGLEFEFILVEGLKHEEAKKIYERADILIDQLLAGWYGALSMELMSLGKPVISYIRDEDMKFIPEQMARELPVISANPSNIQEVLKELIEDREKREIVGRKSREFVEKWHNPKNIAQEVVRFYGD